ncbi:hypothetical protein Lalb_Chr05g0215201 [Lupinus albus]|uniref:Uncharacterized protein n=1 Tax=Lupinus albus TaxID=3870 RepID=A0A6A4QIB7_LUPAL|nr:hypothetical protein Lalb_Chr05g0215201 [Lupinus albus]
MKSKYIPNLDCEILTLLIAFILLYKLFFSSCMHSKLDVLMFGFLFCFCINVEDLLFINETTRLP